MYWVVIVGVNVSGDCRLLRRQFGVNIKRVKEVMEMAKADNPNQRLGLAPLMSQYCDYFVDKTNQTANYNIPSLTKPLLVYCALDLICPLMLDAR